MTAPDPSELIIRSARPEEAEALTKIALAAKSHWGYPPTWIQEWENVLTITPEYIVAQPTFVAVSGEQRVGFCALQIAGNEALLDHLWVWPACMRRGVGRALFEHAETIARATGVVRLKIVGDPHAEGFYARMGATLYGHQPASMDGQERFLPLLEKKL
jgi:GNAT superfamily N-acetyltransferase